MDKIFHAPHAAPAAAGSVPPPSGQVAQGETGAVVASSAAAGAAEPVDVEAVLASMAEMDHGGGNWRASIVDLLKLLQLDSSLAARKSLADELGVHAGEAGSAEQNIALHKAVMRRLAENGGQVPDSFYR